MLSAYSVSLLLMLAAVGHPPSLAAQSTAPLVLYTDLLSGPNSGGENNDGTYLSIFGQNFGTSGLGTSTRVFIGGAEVASYRYLGSSAGRPDVQQITVQVGGLGNPTPGVALPIDVQVNGVNSTSYTPQTFIVNPGRILFVSLTGNDSTAVANDINHPWRYVQEPGSSVNSTPNGAWGNAQPGDVIVMRGGMWTDIGAIDGTNHYFVKLWWRKGSAPTGAAGTGPIAFIGYPNETVTIHPPASSITGVIDVTRRSTLTAMAILCTRNG